MARLISPAWTVRKIMRFWIRMNSITSGASFQIPRVSFLGEFHRVSCLYWAWERFWASWLIVFAIGLAETSTGFMQFYGTSDSLAETSGQVDRNRKSRFVKAIENWRCAAVSCFSALRRLIDDKSKADFSRPNDKWRRLYKCRIQVQFYSAIIFVSRSAKLPYTFLFTKRLNIGPEIYRILKIYMDTKVH